jgi:hypothetical protein
VSLELRLCMRTVSSPINTLNSIPNLSHDLKSVTHLSSSLCTSNRRCQGICRSDLRASISASNRACNDSVLRINSMCTFEVPLCRVGNIHGSLRCSSDAVVKGSNAPFLSLNHSEVTTPQPVLVNEIWVLMEMVRTCALTSPRNFG